MGAAGSGTIPKDERCFESPQATDTATKQMEDWSPSHRDSWTGSCPSSSSSPSPHPTFEVEETPGLGLHLTQLLEAYRTEVRSCHDFMTAADSYYFAMLEFQRRHDAGKIQAQALRWSASGKEEEQQTSWRELLEAAREEAFQALMSRAKHYAIGRRSARSGLLQITAGSDAEATLRKYEKALNEEYDAAASELEGFLAIIHSEKGGERISQRSEALLVAVERNIAFWEDEIESTFETWQAASSRLHQSQTRREKLWLELEAAATALLEELRRPRSAKPNLHLRGSIAQLTSRHSLLRIRACLASKLLEIDIHQYAHGLESSPRRRLLHELLESARTSSTLSAVGQHLIADANFLALAQLPLGETGSFALDILSVPNHPWSSELTEILSEFMMTVVLKPSPLSSPSPAERLLLERGAGLDEVQSAMAKYVSLRQQHRTLLHQAVTTRRSDLVRHLLEMQADPLAVDAAEKTPLTIAQDDSRCPKDLREALEWHSANSMASAQESLAAVGEAARLLEEEGSPMLLGETLAT